MNIDKLKGYVIGSAYGDALGEPVEFMKYSTIIHEFGNEGMTELFIPSSWTDDTEMMMSLAKGILEEKSAELEPMMENIAKSFIKWKENPGIAPGNTCLSAVYNLQSGKSWKESGIKTSKGCGSAMRSGIIGVIFKEKTKILEIAHHSGTITHGHIDAVAASQAAALLVHYAIQDIDIKEFPRLLLEDIGHVSESFSSLL